MNLDEFKILWQAETNDEKAFRRVDVQAIKNLTQGKASHALERLCRNILMDISFLTFFLIIGGVAMILVHNALINGIVIASAVVFAPFFILFFKEYFYLKNIKLELDSLRGVIENVVLSLGRYMKFYFTATMVLTILAVPIGIAIGFYSNNGVDNIIIQAAKNSPQWYAVGFSILFIGLILGNYFFSKWYLRKLYDNYIEMLRACLNELDEVVRLQ